MFTVLSVAAAVVAFVVACLSAWALSGGRTLAFMDLARFGADVASGLLFAIHTALAMQLLRALPLSPGHPLQGRRFARVLTVLGWAWLCFDVVMLVTIAAGVSAPRLHWLGLWLAPTIVALILGGAARRSDRPERWLVSVGAGVAAVFAVVDTILVGPWMPETAAYRPVLIAIGLNVAALVVVGAAAIKAWLVDRELDAAA